LRKNRANAPVRGVKYYEIFLKISKNQFFSATHPQPTLMGVKFGVKESTFDQHLHAKFNPHRCSVSPLRGENLKIALVTELNTAAR